MTDVDVERDKSQLLAALNGVILGDDAISLEEVRERATGIAPFIARSLEPSHVDEVIARVTEMRSVELRLGDGVVDPTTFRQWLADRKATASSVRWDAYRQLLTNRGWAPGVISTLDTQTDTIVELMGDPLQEGEWARRGLVIGEVQSGKTATYVGILNKAMDHGYKIIIIIGGHTEDLRRQTQRRVDTDLIGTDSEDDLDNVVAQRSTAVGVGLLQNEAFSHVLTTVRSDFSSSAKRANRLSLEGDVPFVFVVKKNAGVLRNLATYLKARAPKNRLSVPLIVIDDEADWASVNTKSEDDIAAVNFRIRQLLESSSRSSYLGITATPFANILIDDEIDADLFPRDFIHALQSPSNYVGVEQYFGEEDDGRRNAIRTDIDDCLSLLPFGHKKTARVGELPASLADAIAVFLVGTAIRRMRDSVVKPSSMMVNVSRFMDVQARVHDHVLELLTRTAAGVAAEFSRHEDYEHSPETARLFNAYSAEYADQGTWLQVREALREVLPGVRAELVNGNTMQKRNKRLAEMTREERAEEAALPTVFVGGDVLARGLTLEGLLVSYFVRRAGAADTLLQMGRWFGYRPNYDDLVRIWIDADVLDLFTYVADVSRDLRGSLKEMRAARLTPKEFGLKMRRHPESFLITSANKQKNATEVLGDPTPVGVIGSKLESFSLSSRPKDLARNRDAFMKLVQEMADERPAHSSAGGAEPVVQNVRWESVPFSMVHGFFHGFRGSDYEPFFGSPNGTGPAQLAEALVGLPDGELWTVAVISGRGPDLSIPGGHKIRGTVRNRIQELADRHIYQLGNRRVASPGDLRSTLTEEEVQKGRSWKADQEGLLLEDVDIKDLSEQELVAHSIKRPRLLLYMITTQEVDPVKHRTPPVITATEPLIAAYVAVPGQPLDKEAHYLRGGMARFVANKVYTRSLGYGIDADSADEDSE
ncbi:Z1 domain-containing protein [Clavibacter nebraskensis]|uniref:Z1 domain-containing protein n=1 Tax=Clavibacter nebraskensis TaxID=31963 RepID=UPI003F851F82